MTSPPTIPLPSLAGTDSNTNDAITGANRRFDIDGGPPGSGHFGMGAETWSGATELGLSMNMATVASNHGFDPTAMFTDDQYEIDFTIVPENFAAIFLSSAANAGTFTLYHKVTSSSIWIAGDSKTQTSIVSGTLYQAADSNVGFILKSSTTTVDGFVLFIFEGAYLGSLGATGTSVTLISSMTDGSANGMPGGGSGTRGDLCPATGTTANFPGPLALPEFPVGLAVLVVPIAFIYYYLAKRPLSLIPH